MSSKLVDYSNMNALVAHPNHQLAEYIWHFLRDKGAANVQVAHHSKSVLPRLASLDFTHMIIGYALDDIGGPDFARLVRMLDSKTAEAPIIMVLTNPSVQKVLECRDAGVNEVIITPLTGNQIHRRLHHIISRPKRFIRSDSYIGPERRRASASLFAGIERRQNSSRLQTRIAE